MPSECESCGVTSRGALVRDFGDETLCVDCAAPGECRRCGTDTSNLTLSGEWQCESCGEQRAKQQKSRDADQHSLGRFA